MARSRVHRVMLGRGSDRKMVWFAMKLVNTTVASGGKALLGSLNAAALALRPFTITRTRLLLKYGSDQVANSETPQAAFGMIVVSDQAVATGNAAIPGPGTNTDAPFFVYEGLIDEWIVVSAIGIQRGAFFKEVDSKAMRKVGNNEDVAIMIEQGATFGADIAIEGRMLVKLH